MTYDLNVLGDPRVTKAAMRVNNTAISGPQKLVQRMVVLMFTDSALTTNQGAGTELTEEEVINLTDVEIVRNRYNLALAAVSETLLRETPVSADPSEQLKDARLRVQETDERGTVEIIITVTTKAGDELSVGLPVNTIPEQEENGN